jgi:hypothetical protein
VNLHIETAKASRPLEGFIPNLKLKLLDQLSELARFKQLIRLAPAHLTPLGL